MKDGLVDGGEVKGVLEWNDLTRMLQPGARRVYRTT
jgi:hypothetical protein